MSEERPLNEYIDMEAYDVVSGERYRELRDRLEAAERERDQWAKLAKGHEATLVGALRRNAELVEALERIITGDYPKMLDGQFDPYKDAAEFARAALAKVKS